MDQQWEQLRQRCLACRACSLAQERTQVVFGVGDPAAEVLLVGEALTSRLLAGFALIFLSIILSETHFDFLRRKPRPQL